MLQFDSTVQGASSDENRLQVLSDRLFYLYTFLVDATCSPLTFGHASEDHID